MRCESCQHEDAQIHIEYISDNQKTEYHLCPTCFQKLKAEGGMPALSLLGKGLAPTGEGFHAGGKEAWIKALLAMEGETKAHIPKPVEAECDVCGMTWRDFQKNGLLGCAHCYTVFDVFMPQLLRKLHGHTQHVGKEPEGIPAMSTTPDPIEELRDQLKDALTQEAYEEAAVLRDRILALEQATSEGDETHHAG